MQIIKHQNVLIEFQLTNSCCTQRAGFVSSTGYTMVADRVCLGYASVLLGSMDWECSTKKVTIFHTTVSYLLVIARRYRAKVRCGLLTRDLWSTDFGCSFLLSFISEFLRKYRGLWNRSGSYCTIFWDVVVLILWHLLTVEFTTALIPHLIGLVFLILVQRDFVFLPTDLGLGCFCFSVHLEM